MKRKRVVTRANLHDRLEKNASEHLRIMEVSEERWAAHKASHEVIEQSLRDYKVDANEWRATLNDLRMSFLPKNEFLSEHRALDAKMHGEVVALASKVEALDVRVDQNTAEIKTTTTEQMARRSVFTDSRNVVAMIALLFGIVASALLLLDRITGATTRT